MKMIRCVNQPQTKAIYRMISFFSSCRSYHALSGCCISATRPKKLVPGLTFCHVPFASNLQGCMSCSVRQYCSPISNNDAIYPDPLDGATVFAVSSGQGKCGVCVIRVSGPHTAGVISSVTPCCSAPAPRYATLVNFIHPCTGINIDRGLLLWFPGPHSFTGEDSCEMHVHGGVAVVSAMLEALGACLGTRMAEPGDFTKRAFLNGKLDLTQVEGLSDLIHAESEAQRRQALRQMEGALRTVYTDWRVRLIEAVASIEAYIDFSEDDNIEDGVLDTVELTVSSLVVSLERHLCDSRQGERLRAGVRVAIMGEANVGKSSLLNLLIRRPAAIVSASAGTTRDVVESALSVAGYPVLLADTAGIRHTADSVEREGVRRARQQAIEADLILVVMDAQQLCDDSGVATIHNGDAITDDNIIHRIEDYFTYLGILDNGSNVRNSVSREIDESSAVHETDGLSITDVVLLVNKCDLVRETGAMLNGCVKVRDHSVPCVSLSCVTEEGLDSFLDIFRDRLKTLCGAPGAGVAPSLTQARHRHELEQCLAQLRMSAGQLDLVLAAHHLRLALTHLGKVTGVVGAEEVLDVIFRDFCIGK